MLITIRNRTALAPELTARINNKTNAGKNLKEDKLKALGTIKGKLEGYSCEQLKELKKLVQTIQDSICDGGGDVEIPKDFQDIENQLELICVHRNVYIGDKNTRTRFFGTTYTNTAKSLIACIDIKLKESNQAGNYRNQQAKPEEPAMNEMRAVPGEKEKPGVDDKFTEYKKKQAESKKQAMEQMRAVLGENRTNLGVVKEIQLFERFKRLSSDTYEDQKLKSAFMNILSLSIINKAEIKKNSIQTNPTESTQLLNKGLKDEDVYIIMDMLDFLNINLPNSHDSKKMCHALITFFKENFTKPPDHIPSF